MKTVLTIFLMISASGTVFSYEKLGRESRNALVPVLNAAAGFIKTPYLIISFVYLIILFILWIKYGKEDRTKQPVVIEFKPPAGLSVWQAQIIQKQAVLSRILSMRSLSRIISSTLLTLNYTGCLEFEIVKNRLVKIRTKNIPSPGSFESDFLSILMQGEKEIQMKKFKKRSFLQKVRELVKSTTAKVRETILTRQSFKISRGINGFIDNTLEYVNTLTITYVYSGMEILLLFLVFFSFAAAYIAFVWFYLFYFFYKASFWPKLMPVRVILQIIVYGGISVLYWYLYSKIIQSKTGKKVFSTVHRIWSLIEYPIFVLFKSISYLFIFFIFTAWFGISLNITLTVTFCLILSLIFAPLMPKWSSESLRILQELKGFRKFISRAESDRIKRLATENPAGFKEILPYAVLFGKAGRWKKILRKTGIRDDNFSVMHDLGNYFLNIFQEANLLFEDDPWTSDVVKKADEQS
jgi:hypothetical protein